MKSLIPIQRIIGIVSLALAADSTQATDFDLGITVKLAVAGSANILLSFYFQYNP